MRATNSPTNAKVLLVPGLWNSGPENWQSYWERERGDCQRVQQDNWDTPKRTQWVATLERTVALAAGRVVLVGHSLGCATIAHWAVEASAGTREKVRGTLLVAPSDVEAPLYPRGTEGFVPMPLARLPFPSIVVASTDDRYVTFERAAFFASAWGSRLIDAGAQGHLNADSGLRTWPFGQALLEELLAG
jgi:predicted alpha/beta hydrolase family esterase